jgi:thiol-disulfide isomerase/thioredoxin
MAKTYSTMLELGSPLKTFNLLNPKSCEIEPLFKISQNTKGLVLAFICNHCPYVKLLKPKLKEVSDKYMNKGIEFIAVNSNDIINYPEDSPEKMVYDINYFNYNFRYLFDENQEVAKFYKAVATPDFYLFNQDQILVYRGRFDEATPSNSVTPTGIDLTQAIDCLLSGKIINKNQHPSIGCNIKWKS